MSDLPRELLDVLPEEAAESWVILRDKIPEAMVLYGGTAVDIDELRATLEGLRPLAVQLQNENSLNAVFGNTKVQFLSMTGQYPVEDDVDVAGLRVAQIRDLAATKLKAIGDRGELRDYFDLMVIEEQTGLAAETSLLDYQQRYKTKDQNTLTHIVLGLGYLGDVGDDATFHGHRDPDATLRPSKAPDKQQRRSGRQDLGARPQPQREVRTRPLAQSLSFPNRTPEPASAGSVSPISCEITCVGVTGAVGRGRPPPKSCVSLTHENEGGSGRMKRAPHRNEPPASRASG